MRGLSGLAARVEAIEGRLEIESAPGTGTTCAPASRCTDPPDRLGSALDAPSRPLRRRPRRLRARERLHAVRHRPARRRRHGGPQQRDRRLRARPPVPDRAAPGHLERRPHPGHRRRHQRGGGDPGHGPREQVRRGGRALRPPRQLLPVQVERRPDLQRRHRQRRRRGRGARDRPRHRGADNEAAAVGRARAVGLRGGRAARLALLRRPSARPARRHCRLRQLRHPGLKRVAEPATTRASPSRPRAAASASSRSSAPRSTRAGSTPSS